MNMQRYQYYKKYRIYFIPVFLFVIAIIIVFNIILPEISAVSLRNNEIENKTQEKNTLKTTLNVLTSQDDEKILQDFKTSNMALPATKDVLGIFSALLSSAEKSNVEINGFSLKPGKVSGEKKSDQAIILDSSPFLLVKVNASAPDVKNFATFINTLHKTLPLAEVRKIDAQKSDSSFEINFYYKPLDFIALSKQDTVSPFTSAEENLLRELKDWGH